MHCNRIFRTGAFFIAFSMLLVSACRRDVSNHLADADDNGGYASDLSRIELYNNDAVSIADAAGTNYNKDYIGIEGCVTVAVDTVSPPPHVLIIRFGNCKSLDGRLRNGAIIVKYDGQYTDTAQIHTITFDNYYINGTQLTGSIKCIRVDTTIVGNWYYKISVNDSLNMSLDPLQSQYVIWTGTLVRKWVAGYATLDRSGDIFSVSGSGTLTRPNLHKFSCNISTPLQFAINCDYAESGVVNVTGFNGVRVLNYGTGYCDPNAQLNIGTAVYNFLLTK